MVAQDYGHPINCWCVSGVTNFTSVFDGFRNNAAKTFNEDIGDWGVSNAVSLDSMFLLAQSFNQDLSQ